MRKKKRRKGKGKGKERKEKNLLTATRQWLWGLQDQERGGQLLTADLSTPYYLY